MATKELWRKQIPKPDFRTLTSQEERPLDWIAARIDLKGALDRIGGEIKEVLNSGRAVSDAKVALGRAQLA
jgi:hypothetical protein